MEFAGPDTTELVPVGAVGSFVTKPILLQLEGRGTDLPSHPRSLALLSVLNIVLVLSRVANVT